jgi:hypothetical protein
LLKEKAFLGVGLMKMGREIFTDDEDSQKIGGEMAHLL